MIEKITLNNTEENISISTEDAAKMFDETVVNLDIEVKRPPLAITIGLNEKGYPQKFATLGNISMIMGEEKSRKSFVKSLIEAGTIGGSANYNNDTAIIGHLGDKMIISIDSEQGAYDVWLNGSRVRNMVNAPVDNYKMLMFREKTTLERMAMLDWLFTESPYKDNLGLVVLDGYVDFINDFNNQHECKDFIAKLMKYSSESNCHITGILHVNPSKDGYAKARGHLGSMLQQKCEMVALVENVGKFSTVKCHRMRGAYPFETFTVRTDKDSLPYISNDVVEESRY